MSDKLVKYQRWKKFGWLLLFVFVLSCIKVFPTRVHIYLSGWLTDGILLHKAGEVLLIIPFYQSGLLSFVKPIDKVQQYLQKWRFSMLIGGVLNLLAYVQLKGEMWWDWVCLIIFVWGLFAPQIAGWLFLKRKVRV